MRTVKIFLASSDELSPEREKFDTLFNHLNSIFTTRGIRLEPVKWEYLDASMGVLHKQEEYNREIRDCDICVVMFWQRFGEYTETELQVAVTELEAGRKPFKIYVFFKEPGEVSSQLQEFKKSFDSRYGHFYGKFNSPDKLQLDFVLQLERYLNSNLIKVENSQVKLEGVVVANLDNLGFAAGNEKYKSLKERLEKIEQEIQSLDGICALAPNPVIENMLNDKHSEKFKLKEELDEHEQFLLIAAMRIANFAGERISDRMKRAVDLFEQGNVSEANAVLDEAERDADKILQGVRNVKSLAKQSVDELVFKSAVMLADEKLPIEERITKTADIYAKADMLAKECDYEPRKYDELLTAYFSFLHKYAKYDLAEEICDRLMQLRVKLFGTISLSVINSYNLKGSLCISKGRYGLALDNLSMAVEIAEKLLGPDHPETAASYCKIGYIHYLSGEYRLASETFGKALDIQERTLGPLHPETIQSYSDIAKVCISRLETGKAFEYIDKIFSSCEQVWGHDHPAMAAYLNDIGDMFMYITLNDDEHRDVALRFYNSALEIQEKIFGKDHPDTIRTYDNIGTLYYCKGDYDRAIDYCSRVKVEHRGVARNYANRVWFRNFEEKQELEELYEVLDSRERVLGQHLFTSFTCNHIAHKLYWKGDYDKSLEYYHKELAILEAILGNEHPSVAGCLKTIGAILHNDKKAYDEALTYKLRALDILNKVLGPNNYFTIESHCQLILIYSEMGDAFYEQGDYDKALEYYSIGLEHAIKSRSLWKEFCEDSPYDDELQAKIDKTNSAKIQSE